MRIHADILTTLDVFKAADLAGATIERFDDHGSRKRHHAFEVTLSGASSRNANGGRNDFKAATWDQWGVFLAHLFDIDPKTLTRDYSGRTHFHWATTGRYHLAGEVHGDECPQHKWRYSGENPARGVEPSTSALQRCTKCGALTRRAS